MAAPMTEHEAGIQFQSRKSHAMSRLVKQGDIISDLWTKIRVAAENRDPIGDKWEELQKGLAAYLMAAADHASFAVDGGTGYEITLATLDVSPAYTAVVRVKARTTREAWKMAMALDFGELTWTDTAGRESSWDAIGSDQVTVAECS